MRRPAWTKLLLIGLLGCAAGICVQLVRWGTAPSPERLEVTTTQRMSLEQECQRGMAPANVPICSSVATFEADGGRRFRFASAEIMAPFSSVNPVQASHTADGVVWAIHQGGDVVASYEAIRAVRAEATRVLRALSLLAVAALAGVAAHNGTRHLRSGPPCSCTACLGIDLLTLAALVAGAVGIVRNESLVAAGGTFAAFSLFLLRIERPGGRGHTASSSVATARRQGPIEARARQVTAPYRRWVEAGKAKPPCFSPSSSATTAVAVRAARRSVPARPRRGRRRAGSG